MLGALAALAFAIVVPLSLLALVPNLTGEPASWITFTVLVVTGARMSQLVNSGELRLYEFIFVSFCYIFMGLAPTVQLRSGDMPSTTPDTLTAYYVPAALVASAGIVAFYGGVLLRRATASAEAPTMLSSRSAVSRPRLVLMTAVGIGAAGLYIGRLGPSSFLLARNTFGDIRNVVWPEPTTNVIVQAVAVVPLLVAAHGWIVVARSRTQRSERRAVVLGWSTLLISMFMVNPISSARYTAGTVWASAVGPAGLLRSRTRVSTAMLLIIASLLFVFPYLDFARTAGVSSGRRSGFFGEYLGNGDYDAFAQLVNTLQFTASHSWQPGKQAFGPLLFWLPRSIWPDKPIDTGVLVATFKGYPFSNLSAPLWAEYWVIGALPALLIGFTLIGLLIARLDDPTQNRKSEMQSIAANVLPFYSIILLRGSLLQATGTFVVLCLSLFFIRTRHRPIADSGEGGRF